MLTIIESGSNVWMATTVDDELRIYSRAEAGEWGELSVSEDPEQVEPEKSFMLEELYGRQSGQEEEDEEAGAEGEDEVPDEEDELDEDEEAEDGEDEESEDGEDEEPEEEQTPPRRRAGSAKRGRTAASRK